MNTKYIIIVLGEPFSIFSEIIGKSYKVTKNIKSKIIVVGNINLFQKQLMKLKYKIKLNQINKLEKAKKNIINIINIDFKFTKIFSKISNKSNSYIEKSFSKSLDIIKKSNYKCAMINGPISKKTFLKKKYFGITEYLSNKTNTNEEVMLIYNNKLSVSPLTTHIPLKKVSKNITKNKIINNVTKLEKFYNQTLKIKPRFAILGLNPHCETTDDFSEEDKIIKPAIRKLKLKKINIDGPFSADTFFLNKNIKKYDVVVGMYHDQVLTPIKTMFNFKAINLTVGLPFIRISPDHGPNNEMLGKNKSDPSSLIYAIKFIENLK